MSISVENPEQSKITGIDSLTEYEFLPRSSTDVKNPIVLYTPPESYVSHLTIRILSTVDNAVPKNVVLKVMGCVSETTSKPSSTSTQPNTVSTPLNSTSSFIE